MVPLSAESRRARAAFRYGSIALVVGAVLAGYGAVAQGAIFVVGLVLVLAGLVAVVLARRAEQARKNAHGARAEMGASVAPFLRRWPLVRVRSAPDMDFGVALTGYSDDTNPYVPRVADRSLRYALGVRRFVLVRGGVKAGRSRTLAEAVRQALPDASLVVPRDVKAAAALAGMEPALPLEDAVVLLDDLTAVDLEFLTPAVLEFWSERAVLVGVITPEEVGRAGVVARAVLEKATVVDLPFELTAQELAVAVDDYPEESGFVRGSGIGAVLVGGDELVRRLRTGRRDSPAGQAIVRAAVDARVAGLRRPITEPELVRLFPKYLERITVGVDPAEEVFLAGLEWATAPVRSQVALLRRVTGGFEVLDYVVAAEGGGGLPEDADVDLLAVTGVGDAYGIACAARDSGRVDFAREAFRRAMEHEGSSAAAGYALGGLLVEQGDAAAAERAYRQVVDGGDGVYAGLATVGLGDLLASQGDSDGARAVYLKAVESGDPEVVAWGKAALGG
ncbi:tetratricopeptide repeat protein [Umezawaea endophytica]|uniref:Tetratricopeptide repeat protein n=1 Tax=Umezawaea endophytica TaxID=1654476 RepID=A0A9X3AL38_9PSEU|nr:tetratricopeptide repeat protein [Umezawaea endophytica]MCS7483840.1 tetratricopeptide repeat protein [Umezawaea endophytica]